MSDSGNAVPMDWRRRQQEWRTKGRTNAKWYLALSAIAVLYRLAVIFWRWPDLGPFKNMLVVSFFLLGLPIYFAVEFADVEKASGKADTAELKEDAKQTLDSVRGLQDAVSKVWLAIAAGVAFLYLGDYPKKESSPPIYNCTAGPNAGFVCSPQAQSK